MKPIAPFHFQNVLQNAKQFRSLKQSHHYGIFMGFHRDTGLAQQWHVAVTCNVTVVIVKTIVNAGYWPYQITQNQSYGFII